MKNSKSFGLIFTFVMTIIGSIIGAGFASGKEVLTFFASYGWIAYILIGVAILLFGFTFFVFTEVGRKLRPHNFSEISKAIFGKAYVVFDVIIMLCLFVVISAMFAGADSLAVSYFGEKYSFPWLSILTGVVVVLVLSGGKNSMFNASKVIVPIIVLLIIGVITAFFIVAPKEVITVIPETTTQSVFKGILFACLYVGLNTMTECFIVARASEGMNKKQNLTASIITSAFLGIMIVLITLALLNSSDIIFRADMPLVKIANLTNDILGNIYGLVLWLAILTTAIASVYTLTSWLKQFINNKFTCTC
ncbi:MAG: hypothetical protein KBT30_01015, partial [Clostridiales bacterium]|nr:hypothetical protein [Candidatus Apopatousia equi]